MAIQASPPRPQPLLECQTKKRLPKQDSFQVAFTGYDKENQWVTLQTTAPLLKRRKYTQITLKLDSEETEVWVRNRDLAERFFSNIHEVWNVLRYFYAPLCTRLTEVIHWCTHKDMKIPDEEIAKMVLIGQEHFGDQSLSKLSRANHGIARTMLAGKNKAFILFTRNQAESDPIIGSGTTKRVKLACAVHTGQVHAVSITRKEHCEHFHNRALIEREIQLLKKCRGMDGVIQIDTSLILPLPDRIYTILEYADLGDLHTRFKRMGWTLDVKLKVAIDIAIGLSKLHLAGILHQDLKPSNILLMQSSRTGNLHQDLKPLNILLMQSKRIFAKICDLGCGSLKTDPRELKRERKGSPGYLAPECIESFYEGSMDDAWIASQTPAKDIWALGVLFFELFHPVTGTRIAFQTAENMRGAIRDLTELDIITQIENSGIHWQVQRLIASMLSINPNKRPNPTEVFRALKNVSLEEA